jgi:hypothetical protein
VKILGSRLLIEIQTRGFYINERGVTVKQLGLADAAALAMAAGSGHPAPTIPRASLLRPPPLRAPLDEQSAPSAVAGQSTPRTANAMNCAMAQADAGTAAPAENHARARCSHRFRRWRSAASRAQMQRPAVPCSPAMAMLRACTSMAGTAQA